MFVELMAESGSETRNWMETGVFAGVVTGSNLEMVGGKLTSGGPPREPQTLEVTPSLFRVAVRVTSAVPEA